MVVVSRCFVLRVLWLRASIGASFGHEMWDAREKRRRARHNSNEQQQKQSLDVIYAWRLSTIKMQNSAGTMCLRRYTPSSHQWSSSTCHTSSDELSPHPTDRTHPTTIRSSESFTKHCLAMIVERR
jgi:hypothetical protein